MILAHGNTSQSAKTAAIVLQSLTPNAQSVFKVIAEYQLSHPDEEGKWPLVIGTKVFLWLPFVFIYYNSQFIFFLF